MVFAPGAFHNAAWHGMVVVAAALRWTAAAAGSAVRGASSRFKRTAMNATSDHIYTSSNGDTWHLARDPQSGSAVVRHQANLSSGGKITKTDVDTFLRQAGSGPEFAALRRLLDQT
jgi:hypothetical protein